MAKGQFTAAGQASGGERGFIKGSDPMNLSVTSGVGTFESQWFVSNKWEPIKVYPATGVVDAFTNVANGTRVRVKCITFTSGPIDWDVT